MNIQEAVKMAMEKKAFIVRKTYGMTGNFHMGVIKPGNSYETCIISTFSDKGFIENSFRCWNPTADDLMANDWEIVKL